MANNLTKLTTTLSSLLQVLTSLRIIMAEEQIQLMSAQPESLRLASLSEDKQSLLVTLEFIDKLRHQQEQECHCFAPYPVATELAAYWQQIMALSQQLSNANQHTALLLNQQLAWTQKVLAVLAPLEAQKFYGPDGHPVQKE